MASAEPPLRLRADGLAWRVLEDETIVLDLVGSRYIAVNHTGTALWPLLAEGATRGQLVAALTRQCDIAEAEAARDVDAFCARLEAEGLLDAS